MFVTKDQTFPIKTCM